MLSRTAHLTKGKTNMYRTIITMLTATAIVATSMAASAQTGVTKISVPVFYGDLDLAKLAGKHTLLGRIQRASDQACGGRTVGLSQSDQYWRCVRDATANALNDIGLPDIEDRVAGNRRTAGR
jgi:UrcA family protein